MAELSKEREAKRALRHCCEDDEDPGVMFVLWPTATGAATVHACLALPSVANLRPPLRQGRRIAIEEGSVATNLMLCLFCQAPPQNNL